MPSLCQLSLCLKKPYWKPSPIISLIFHWPEWGHMVTLSCKGVRQGELFLALLEEESEEEERCEWLSGGHLKTSAVLSTASKNVQGCADP